MVEKVADTIQGSEDQASKAETNTRSQSQP